jgi:hypothetical protein
LIVQAAQYIFFRAGMVVLDKDRVNAGLFLPGFLVEAFVKKSARVAEDFWLDDQDVGDVGFYDVHRQQAMGERL